MTGLCLYNNISRHIKIMSMILNFVTEICNNFLDLKIRFWILSFVTEVCSNFLERKKIRFGTNYVSRTV